MEKDKNLMPRKIDAGERFDTFDGGEYLWNKKKGHLPAMGWNSWNAFGSGNTEALTKVMADKFIELGLDQLGYQYIVLDDGCYKPERVDGKLANEEVKFPDDFRVLADYIHNKGLKFGMYNDIGTNLCAGAAVGTCGHEKTDAKSYIDWGVDFIKVDNCYYLWDNATFSDATNARYVYAPKMKKIVLAGNGLNLELDAVKDGVITGEVGKADENGVTGIGTFDGTGPGPSPVGVRSSELQFQITAETAGEYILRVTYASGREEGIGNWLQVAVGDTGIVFDELLPETADTETFAESADIRIALEKGENTLRLMNHRRQENTLNSYGALLQGFNEVCPDHDIILSICEWGKTQPQNWGYKVGDSWRILNDITFRVGSDGDPGVGNWTDPYTCSVTTQYNKCVIMDSFAGLDKGWNDPDMLMVGMNGLTLDMNRSHMAMWCMMNSPLMLGLDLRRVEKGDELWQIIANKELIALNQDALGIQAKRIFSTLSQGNPETEYITDNARVDILAKPLADGSVALAFFNLNSERMQGDFAVNAELIARMLQDTLVNATAWKQATNFSVKDLWTGEESEPEGTTFAVTKLEANAHKIIRVMPK